ncbi:MAG TPA: hypothetical protein VL551_29940 [Actinospica sp.]|jgi:hypothetical protein|nr:hypothetical protein [Actinospica sp.]
MRRASFIGAMAAIAAGAILAFAVHSTPHWLDLQQAGVIILLGGLADLIVRFLISDSPLLNQQAADVAAVVEPLGDPVLDAAGNPVNLPPTASPIVTTGVEVPVDSAYPAEAWRHPDTPAAHDRAVYERALRAADDGGGLDTPESPIAVTTITGKPVRPRGRGLRRVTGRGSRET